MQAYELTFIRLIFLHQGALDVRQHFPGLDGANHYHDDGEPMLDKNGQRPLGADGKKAIVMWAGAQLEKTSHQQDAHAEPGKRLKPFLQGGDQAELVGQFQGPGGGGQKEQVDRRETPDPGNGCQHVNPVNDRKDRSRRCIHDR